MVHKLDGDFKLQGNNSQTHDLKGGKIMEGNQTNNQTQTNTQNNQNNGTAAENGQQNGAGNSQQSTGEKTFTQAEVDQIVKERLARANKTTTQNTQQQTVEPPAVDAQIAEVRSQYVGAKVESVMATSGIKPEKIERAAKLVDKSKCVDKDGNPDTEKIKTEIEELLKDFPELKTTTEEGSAGFKFGANSSSGTAESEISSKVSAIFGNKK